MSNLAVRIVAIHYSNRGRSVSVLNDFSWISNSSGLAAKIIIAHLIAYGRTILLHFSLFPTERFRPTEVVAPKKTERLRNLPFCRPLCFPPAILCSGHGTDEIESTLCWSFCASGVCCERLVNCLLFSLTIMFPEKLRQYRCCEYNNVSNGCLCNLCNFQIERQNQRICFM